MLKVWSQLIEIERDRLDLPVVNVAHASCDVELVSQGFEVPIGWGLARTLGTTIG